MKLVYSILVSFFFLLYFNVTDAKNQLAVTSLSINSEFPTNATILNSLDWNGGKKKKGTVTNVDLGVVVISENGTGVIYVVSDGSGQETQVGSLVDFTATDQLDLESGHLLATEVSLSE